MRTDNELLRITSLLSIVLMTIHVADDIVRGLSPAAPDNAFGVLIFLVWLIGTLPLGRRASGYIIMLLGGVFAAAMPVLHMNGRSYPAIAASRGGLFFVWTLLAVGITGSFAIVLAIRALWEAWARRAGSPPPSGTPERAA